MNKQAKEISIKYNFPLIRKWKGSKLFWHVWHKPYIAWFINYEKYIDRIIKIEQTKPQNQKQERYQLMKPIKQKFKTNAKLEKAYAEWEKTNTEWEKTNAEWKKAYDEWEKTNAEWEKAYDEWEWKKAYTEWKKAYDEWEKTNAEWYVKNHALMTSSHKRECPNCKWDGERLPQFEEVI